MRGIEADESIENKTRTELRENAKIERVFAFWILTWDWIEKNENIFVFEAPNHGDVDVSGGLRKLCPQGSASSTTHDEHSAFVFHAAIIPTAYS